MRIEPIVLTESDKEVLNSYGKVLEGFADYLGNSYEFVLHSLADLDHSAIKVINGYHTGRSVGAPITDLALNMLDKIQKGDGVNNHICYQGINKDGHPLRSTTITIENDNRLIGLICINFYMDTPLSDLLNVLTNSAYQPEVYVQSTEEMVHTAVETALESVIQDGLNESSKRNREIISRLNDAGVFRMKEAVDLVAEELSISRNTVYLHLRNINAKTQDCKNGQK